MAEKINSDLERVIDAAHQDWLKESGNDHKQRQHPSRDEYGRLFRQIFPWAGAVLKVKESGGADDRN